MMMESKDTPVDNIEGLRQRKGSTAKVELVKSPGAQFQGSFAAGARKKDWTKENEFGIINKVSQYLFSNWNSKAIWSAAVRLP